MTEIELLDCPCGGKPILSETTGVLNNAEWKSYICSNRYKTSCRLVKYGSSRNLNSAAKKWNKSVRDLEGK